jgi:Cu(I)/Ag(I) efflux system membrane fusion protein
MKTRTRTVATLLMLLPALVILLPAFSTAQEENDILYWTCGMHPSVRAEGPGKCPICHMDLVPVRRGQVDQQGGVSLTLSQRARELAGVRTWTVGYLPLERIIRATGQLEYDERRMARISAWIPGRIDQLFVDFTGAHVVQGQPLAEIYSPELITAQQEYLLSLETADKLARGAVPEAAAGARELLESSRQKLLLMGMTGGQIEELREKGRAGTQNIVTAPLSGTVIHKSVEEGQYVLMGQHLFEIAELSTLWLMAQIFETDMALVRVGQDVQVTTTAYPGEIFHGRVAFIDPFLDPATRSVHARVDVPNPDRRLKPGLSADAVLRLPVAQQLKDFYTCPMHPQVNSVEPGECPRCGMLLEKVSAGLVLAVPASAVLDAGTRKLVYIQEGEGTFRPVEVTVGPPAVAGDQVEKYVPVLSGLTRGDEVVTRANFLIDSQTQLTGQAAGAYGGALKAEGGKQQHVHE